MEDMWPVAYVSLIKLIKHMPFFSPKKRGKNRSLFKNHNLPTFNHLTYCNTFRCCLLSSFAGRIFPGAPWFFAFYDVKHEHCFRVVRSGWLVAAACIWGEILGWLSGAEMLGMCCFGLPKRNFSTQPQGHQKFSEEK